MQIRLTVVDPLGPSFPARERAMSCDVLVTAPAGTALAAVASALASAVAGGDGTSGSTGTPVLYAGDQRLDAQRCTLGEPPLIDGAVLAVGAPGEPETHPELDEAPTRLHVVAGPDAGGVHLLHGGEIRIGRSADADVPLDDPDVSRLHCAVTVAADGRVSVADLGSTNGTTLDGRRVGPRPVRLIPGALLRIGESALRLTPAAGPHARAATTPDGEGHVRVPGPRAGEESGGGTSGRPGASGDTGASGGVAASATTGSTDGHGATRGTGTSGNTGFSHGPGNAEPTDGRRSPGGTGTSGNTGFSDGPRHAGTTDGRGPSGRTGFSHGAGASENTDFPGGPRNPGASDGRGPSRGTGTSGTTGASGSAGFSGGTESSRGTGSSRGAGAPESTGAPRDAGALGSGGLAEDAGAAGASGRPAATGDNPRARVEPTAPPQGRTHHAYGSASRAADDRRAAGQVPGATAPGGRAADGSGTQGGQPSAGRAPGSGSADGHTPDGRSPGSYAARGGPLVPEQGGAPGAEQRGGGSGGRTLRIAPRGDVPRVPKGRRVSQPRPVAGEAHADRGPLDEAHGAGPADAGRRAYDAVHGDSRDESPAAAPGQRPDGLRDGPGATGDARDRNPRAEPAGTAGDPAGRSTRPARTPEGLRAGTAHDGHRGAAPDPRSPHAPDGLADTTGTPYDGRDSGPPGPAGDAAGRSTRPAGAPGAAPGGFSGGASHEARHGGPPAPGAGTAHAPEGPTGSTTGRAHGGYYAENPGSARAPDGTPDHHGSPAAHASDASEAPGTRKGTPVRGTDLPPSPGGRKRGGIGAWARRLAGGRQEREAPATARGDHGTVPEGWPAPEPALVAPVQPETWPDPATLLLTALGPGPRLWERGPGHPEALTVRLGTTDRTAPDGSGLLPAVPVTSGLREVGTLGLAGPRERLTGLARAVLAQLAALHSPDSLEIVLIAADHSRPLAERATEWSWLGWLPHVRPGHGQDCRLLLAHDREQATARADELLRRLADHDHAAAPVQEGEGPYTVVVVDGDPGGAEVREAVARLALDGPRAGIHVVCLAETPAASPSSPVTETYEAACAVAPAFRQCGAVALLSGDVATALRLLRVAGSGSGTPPGPVGHGTLATVDAVSPAWAERFARALAPLRTDGAPGERHARVSAPLPRSARLLDELGLARATPASLMARWADAADDTQALGGRVSAILGAGPRGPVVADLAADGPHLLIEGAPGSGRTELLRAVVASLAAAERPDRLGIVLVDGRGGGATGAGHGEGLRVCTDVPHVTTHLGANDPVRMREFAQSLSAELKRRAELLGRSDFAEWHTGRELSDRMVAQRTAASRAGAGTGGQNGDLDTPPSSTLRLRPGAGRNRTEAPKPLPRLVVVVDDLDALVSPALGSPGRPAAGSVMRALEAVARDGERLGVHLVTATGPCARTAGTEPVRQASLRVVLDPPVPGGGPDDPVPGRGRLARPDGRETAFQGGRVTGRIPRTATLRPTVVPLEWHRMGDPPARRQVRELGNGPTDLALLASALERAARQVSAAEVPSLL
ncbi:FHA domain-containing protein [Streptomyces sp. NPDC001273]|uniref:FHA domain-containing protein n=1 Tax=unclassified Streptomyces TaxID=2593676 RepID=UPI0033DE2B35